MDKSCESEFLSKKKTLIKSKNKTNDYFDLTIKTT